MTLEAIPDTVLGRFDAARLLLVRRGVLRAPLLHAFLGSLVLRSSRYSTKLCSSLSPIQSIYFIQDGKSGSLLAWVSRWETH